MSILSCSAYSQSKTPENTVYSNFESRYVIFLPGYNWEVINSDEFNLISVEKSYDKPVLDSAGKKQDGEPVHYTQGEAGSYFIVRCKAPNAVGVETIKFGNFKTTPDGQELVEEKTVEMKIKKRSF